MAAAPARAAGRADQVVVQETVESSRRWAPAAEGAAASLVARVAEWGAAAVQEARSGAAAATAGWEVLTEEACSEEAATAEASSRQPAQAEAEATTALAATTAEVVTAAGAASARAGRRTC